MLHVSSALMHTAGVGVTCRDDAATRVRKVCQRRATCDVPMKVKGVNRRVGKERVR